MTINLRLITNGSVCRLPLTGFGLMRHVLLACVLLFASILIAPSKAEAHTLHMPAQVAEAAADTGSGDADVAGKAAACETFCCSPATCASALLSLSGQIHGLTMPADRYAVLADLIPEALPPTALKRPPRS